MTIRLDSCVVRGELDNRLRGRVTGALWLVGQSEPLELDLKGDAMRDLAGHRVRFRARVPPDGPPELLHRRQTGEAGRVTASRKVKVPACSGPELVRNFRHRREFDWRHEPLFQLEWFGDRDGRVVLESTGLELILDGAPAWSLSAEDEEARQRELLDLARRADEADLLTRIPVVDPHSEDEDRPMMERIADREDARMEQLNDRIQARLDQLDDIDREVYDRVYQEEREKLRIEWGEPEPEPPTAEQIEERERWIEELNAAADEALEEMENADWEEPGPHPLVERCSDLGYKISDDLRQSGWIPREYFAEHPLRELAYGVQFASAKLAGGLNTLEDEWPPPDYAIGNLLVRLKKAREHLRDALAGLDAADEENLAVPDWRRAARREVEDVLGEVLDLIDEVRKLA